MRVEVRDTAGTRFSILPGSSFVGRSREEPFWELGLGEVGDARTISGRMEPGSVFNRNCGLGLTGAG